MTVPSANEVATYLTGIYKRVRGEEAGLQYLDLSLTGFWRSFWAYAYALPAFGFFWILDRDVQLQGDPDLVIGAGFFIKAAFTDILRIAAALGAVALAARPLGISGRFAQWVIVANWLVLPVLYVLAAVGLAAYSVSGAGGSGPLIMIAILAALIVSWRVYRSTLGGDGLLAFMVLLISEFASGFVSVVLG
ncbi:MAG: hypothetical protein GY933_10280 [Hyphomicrobiales bacterium]|nr:hypothetical protein [Hyphomicrobiales bacterium]